ncbi:hypothetical protein BDR05DRAFT_1002503 [Suillus weaverae]|nr:hypothetical protein BDR05DRAFT_1002503 [Suillus weaverae]
MSVEPWDRREYPDPADPISEYIVFIDKQILFYKGKKSQPHDDSPPSGSDKGKIHTIIAKHIFEKDEQYQNMYAEDQAKFMQAVGNCLTYLKGKYKTHHACFKQMGTGVNLLAQVLADFPWYDDLDEIWRDNSMERKSASPPNPGQHIEHPMVVVHDAHNAPDVEDKHIDSALNPLEDHPPTNPSCNIKDHLPYNTMDVDVNPDFTMCEELDYGGIELQHADTMQED